MSTIDEDRDLEPIETGVSHDRNTKVYDQQELLMQSYDVYSTEKSNRFTNHIKTYK
jgi:hypothetical protein